MFGPAEAPDVTRRVSYDPDLNTFSATRRLRTSGNSKIITVPPQIAEAVKFEADDQIELIADIDDGEIVLRKPDDG